MKRTYVHANNMGLVYRFTQRNWRRFLKAVAAGNEPEYGQYGRLMLQIDYVTTDLDAEGAEGLLKD